MNQKRHKKLLVWGVLLLAAATMGAFTGCNAKDALQRQAAEALKQKYAQEFQVGSFHREGGMFPGDGTDGLEAVAYPVARPELKFRVRMYADGDFPMDGYRAALAAEEMSELMKEIVSPYAEDVCVRTVSLNDYAGGDEDAPRETGDSLRYYFEAHGVLPSFLVLATEDPDPQKLYSALESRLAEISNCDTSFTLYFVSPQNFSKARRWLEKQEGLPSPEDLRAVVPSLCQMNCGFEDGAMSVPLEKFVTR